MNDDDFKTILESIKLEAKRSAELRLRAEALLEVVRQWSVTTSNKEAA
jgi:hypothetical protein